MSKAETSKRWFELECRRCTSRFVEMKYLLFHRCPGSEPKLPRLKTRRERAK
jgi:hypothetical protein